MAEKPDVEFTNCGSIMMVTPVSDAAKAWVKENVPLESWQWLGGGFSVEPRYAANLCQGMVDDGLQVA